MIAGDPDLEDHPELLASSIAVRALDRVAVRLVDARSSGPHAVSPRWARPQAGGCARRLRRCLHGLLRRQPSPPPGRWDDTGWPDEECPTVRRAKLCRRPAVEGEALAERSRVTVDRVPGRWATGARSSRADPSAARIGRRPAEAIRTRPSQVSRRLQVVIACGRHGCLDRFAVATCAQATGEIGRSRISGRPRTSPRRAWCRPRGSHRAGLSAGADGARWRARLETAARRSRSSRRASDRAELAQRSGEQRLRSVIERPPSADRRRRRRRLRSLGRTTPPRRSLGYRPRGARRVLDRASGHGDACEDLLRGRTRVIADVAALPDEMRGRYADQGVAAPSSRRWRSSDELTGLPGRDRGLSPGRHRRGAARHRDG